MRDDLRRDSAEIWVIDCSPEGHQPRWPHVFQGVQQPVCITLAARAPGKDRTKPALLRFRALPEGNRNKKFRALTEIALTDSVGLRGRAAGVIRFCLDNTTSGRAFQSWRGYLWSVVLACCLGEHGWSHQTVKASKCGGIDQLASRQKKRKRN
jgi:hypothetical protein